jgi:hypothetical protein
VSDRTESVEQHRRELDHKNESEEEDENQTNRFKLEVFFGYVNLRIEKNISNK